MATKEKQSTKLSEFATDFGIDFWQQVHVGIIVSTWNSEITDSLFQAAYDTLVANGIYEQHVGKYIVPGAFELPSAASMLLNSSFVPHGIIAIGSVIRGETQHFDYVCQGVTYGLQKLTVQTGIPITFCVLTDNNLQQARDRSGGKYGNKGEESAITCMEMIALSQMFLEN